MALSVDGIEQFYFAGTVTPPADAQWGGYNIYAHDESFGSDHSHDVLLGSWGPTDLTWKAGPFPIDSRVWDLYCVSYDVNNEQNALVPGFTPRITGLQATAQTSGSMVATRLSSSTYASTFAVLSSKFDVATAGVVTNKIAAASITQALMANASIGTAQIISASITGALIASATITGANIASATITDANIVSLSAAKITAGTISAVTITSLTCNGGAISGTSLTLNSNGITTTINNNTDSIIGGAVGVKVDDGTNHADVASNGFYAIDSSGNVCANIIKNALGNYGTIGLFDNSGSGNKILINVHTGAIQIGTGLSPNQIITTRQTGPGTPSFASFSDVQTWCSNLLNALRTHGLVT